MTTVAVRPTGAAFGDNDAVGAGEVCRADNGAEIVRVFDAVQQKEERIFLSLFGKGIHFFDVTVMKGGDTGNDALMASCLAHMVEAVLWDKVDHDAAFFASRNMDKTGPSWQPF